MRANLDTILTVREAATLFTMLRPRRPVTTHMVYGWISRNGLTKLDGGYRYGDLLNAEKRARRADTGGGRGRPKAA